MTSARSQLRQRISELREIPLLAGCTTKELARVDRLGTEVQFRPGRTLTREGAEGYEVFLVRAGVAAATRGGRPVGAIRAGSVAGEMALLDGTVRTATVVATAPLRVVVYTAKEFKELLAAAPCVAVGVRRIAAERRANLSRPDTHRGPWQRL